MSLPTTVQASFLICISSVFFINTSKPGSPRAAGAVGVLDGGREAPLRATERWACARHLSPALQGSGLSGAGWGGSGKGMMTQSHSFHGRLLLNARDPHSHPPFRMQSLSLNIPIPQRDALGEARTCFVLFSLVGKICSSST